jgi:hypothetical protein
VYGTGTDGKLWTRSQCGVPAAANSSQIDMTSLADRRRRFLQAPFARAAEEPDGAAQLAGLTEYIAQEASHDQIKNLTAGPALGNRFPKPLSSPPLYRGGFRLSRFSLG